MRKMESLEVEGLEEGTDVRCYKQEIALRLYTGKNKFFL